MKIFLLAILVAACGPAWSENFTTSDGVRLHYIAEGEGETLLFVPGWLMPAEIWRRQIDYFSARYRVIALDPRSQGDSQVAALGNDVRRRAEDLHDLIEHLQAQRETPEPAQATENEVRPVRVFQSDVMILHEFPQQCRVALLFADEQFRHAYE